MIRSGIRPPSRPTDRLLAGEVGRLARRGPAPPRPRHARRDFHGERGINDTSTTDPDARLFRRGDGKEARLCFMVMS